VDCKFNTTITNLCAGNADDGKSLIRHSFGNYVKDKDTLNNELIMEMKYNNNKLNGEFKVLRKGLEEYGHFHSRYYFYEEDELLIEICVIEKYVSVTYYNKGVIYKKYLYISPKRLSDKICNIYSEISFCSKWAEKVKFINSLRDGYYSDIFEISNIDVYLTKEELAEYVGNKNIKEIFKMFKNERVTLNHSNFSFLFNHEDSKYKINIYRLSYAESSLSELVINDNMKAELKIADYSKCANSEIDKLMEGIGDLAILLGCKEIHVFDRVYEEYMSGKVLLSLISKLSGGIFYYEKYGYQIVDDINEINNNFEKFCKNNIDVDMSNIFKKYMEMVNNNNKLNCYCLLKDIYDFLSKHSDKEELINMNVVISKKPFVKFL